VALSKDEGASLTAERLLARFSDASRLRRVTRDIDPPAFRRSQYTEEASSRAMEINQASATMLLVAMAFALRDGGAEIEGLLQSEDPDVRLASAFYLGDCAESGV
jgi:hypothetical protein